MNGALQEHGPKVLLSRFPRGVKLALMSLLMGLPDHALDSRQDDSPDRGLSVAFLASMSGYSDRHFRRLVREAEQLGCHRYPRIGKTNHWSFDPAPAAYYAQIEQTAVFTFLADRAKRNAGKQPLDAGYEDPEIPPPLRGAPPGGEPMDGVPGWLLTKRIPDCYDRRDVYQLILAADLALFGAPTSPAEELRAEERRCTDAETIVKLARKRAYPTTERLARDIASVVDTVRSCRDPGILYEFRGISAKPGQRTRVVGHDWVQRHNVKPAWLLAPERFARLVPLAERHAAGLCGCSRDPVLPLEPPTPADPDTESAGEPGELLAELLGAPAEGDPAELWRGALERVRARLGARDVATWLEPLEVVGCAGDALIVAAPNRYYSDWIAANCVDAWLAAGNPRTRLVAPDSPPRS